MCLKQQQRQYNLCLILWSIFPKTTDCLFFSHTKVGFQDNRLFSPTSEVGFRLNLE